MLSVLLHVILLHFPNLHNKLLTFGAAAETILVFIFKKLKTLFYQIRIMAGTVVQHTFQFNPKFEHIQLHVNCELRFFCEAFSLMDSMRRVSVLLKFTQTIHERKGAVESDEIITILQEEGLIKPETLHEPKGFYNLLDHMYDIINQIVIYGFVSSSRTSTLGSMAYEVSELYGENGGKKGGKFNKDKIKAWMNLAERLQVLAEYQQTHKRIHHDFQKSNYAPDPRAKTLYGSTFVLIILGFLYLLLRNCNIGEAKEFMWLLSK